MRILGVSCDYHDAAAALVVDGEIVAACEEERFSRVKHDASLPKQAIASCLAIAGIGPDDLDVVVFHEKPLGVYSRVLASRRRVGLRSLPTFVRETPTLLSHNLQISYRLERALFELGATRPPQIRFGEHHLSHAGAAFWPSPFASAAILTIDGIGEWSTASIGHGVHHRIDLLAEQRFPHSLGLVYSLITRWCGFAPNDGEYKVMGLAPYGQPTFADALARLVDVGDDGSLTVDGRLVKWWRAGQDDNDRLAQLLGGPPAELGAGPDQRAADLARSMQDLTETIVLRMATEAHRLTGATNLCLAGGVALNCVANGRVQREGPFDQVWVQPAAGDAGSAVGAALWCWHDLEGNTRPDPTDPANPAAPPADAMSGALLGPSFSTDEVAAYLGDADVAFEPVADDEELCALVASRLAEGAVVGWFQGAMEFGPRALGNRSILADPRSPTIHRDLNLRVKGRESFRPFAPAVTWEHAPEWFDIAAPSPYMLATVPVRADRLVDVRDEPTALAERATVARSQIPACTHIDGSARVQTVHRETSPLFHQLIEAFHQVTGVPVLLNTSFNTAGEPVVCTPADALATARRAGLDVLVIGRAVIDLADRPSPADDRHPEVVG